MIHVSNMCQTCVKHVSNMCQTCVKHVSNMPHPTCPIWGWRLRRCCASQACRRKCGIECEWLGRSHYDTSRLTILNVGILTTILIALTHLHDFDDFCAWRVGLFISSCIWHHCEKCKASWFLMPKWSVIPLNCSTWYTWPVWRCWCQCLHSHCWEAEGIGCGKGCMEQGGYTIHLPSNSNNTSKQYDILVTRGWMKTLAIRSDFDFKFSGVRVLI